MEITLFPRLQAQGDALVLDALQISRQGQALTINGQSFDFSVVPNGATLPDAQQATGCAYFFGPMERDTAGVLKLSLWLPCDFKGASESARFPEPIIDPPDGPVSLPQTNWPPAAQGQGGEDASN